MKFVSLAVLSSILLTAAAIASDQQPEASASGEQTRTAASASGDQAGAAASASGEHTEAAGASPPYEVKDGNKVDAATLQGWKTWRALACERCHGAAQEGMVGPSLIESLKILSKEQFHDRLMNGSPKGMPPFSGSEMVTKNWEGLYAYLKGRSDGAIEPGRLTAIEQN